MATFVRPSRHGRPKVSETITATSAPHRSFRSLPSRLADASGSTGSRETRSCPGTFEASTPALAQMKPWVVSAMITPRSIRTMRLDSRRTTSTKRGSLPQVSANSRARPEGTTSVSRTTRPSAFDTTFCATTRTSPVTRPLPSRSAASEMRRARSFPSAISGIPGSPTTVSPRSPGRARRPIIPRRCNNVRVRVSPGNSRKAVRSSGSSTSTARRGTWSAVQESPCPSASAWCLWKLSNPNREGIAWGGRRQMALVPRPSRDGTSTTAWSDPPAAERRATMSSVRTAGTSAGMVRTASTPCAVQARDAASTEWLSDRCSFSSRTVAP